MINTKDILETIEMIDNENLDVRTITMGISLMNCADGDARSTLSAHLVNRQISAIQVADKPFDPQVIDVLREKTQTLYGISLHESDYFVNTGILRNHAYDYNDQEIRVLFKDGSCRDIGDASDQLDRHFLEKQVTKYYLCFPKELKTI